MEDLNASYDELKWNSAPPLDHNDDDGGGGGGGVFHTTCSSNDEPVSFQAERTALLIVDVQPEYWSQCPAVRCDFPDFPSNLAATIAIGRRRHAQILIWVRADYRYSHSPWLKQFARLHGLDDANFRTEVPCDPTSEEFQWEPFATPANSEIVLPKTSWSSTSNTALADILRAHNIDTVLVCGLITSVCVQHSAFGVFEAGYRTVLVTDACADRGRARHDAALALYGDYMYSTVTSRDLARQLQPPPAKLAALQHPLKPSRPLWITSDKTKTGGGSTGLVLATAHGTATPADEEESSLTDKENNAGITTEEPEQDYAPLYVQTCAE